MKRIFLSLSFAMMFLLAHGQRSVSQLSDDWYFHEGDLISAEKPDFNDGNWQRVSVPHDWAIRGPFDKKWDLQVVRIVQNGEKEASEKTGRSGALPWIGMGTYVRDFTIPADFNGHAELVFDGAMSQPTVYVNGKVAGYWAYGYNAFRLDVTRLVRPGRNQMRVLLRNQEESSRWYPGAGIYRPVHLVLTAATHIDDWSLFARTTRLDKGRAEVQVDLQVASPRPTDKCSLSLTDAEGREVATAKAVAVSPDGRVHVGLRVPDARLWSPESPYLYRLVAQVTDGEGRLVDEMAQKVGLRTIRVSREHGFQLNGQTRKLKGVCLHHDLGPLGAAVNRAALVRQIKIMKEMGCDAIRTAHNMPSQWQMEVCDSLGMMVMAESFDMWIYPKCKNGYAQFFHEWADRDITNLVLANRNHPSIVMWSIGNEIPEQWSEEGRQIAVRLQGLCHSLDPTRPVTQGMDRAEAALGSGMAQVMDVPGFNYRVHKYEKNLSQLPQGFLLGSETASTVSSRGVYHFPVVAEAADNPKSDLHRLHYNGQCSSYDVQYCSWSNLPDDDWRWQDDMPWVIGEFVWTGFDYLGEPSPYDGYWPSRSSYFGICDLAGLPKDRYYLYRSHWNTQAHTLHLLPHWTWGKERRGEVTPVYCYTDYPTAELFVNGKSFGKRTKAKDAAAASAGQTDNRLDRYRLRWNDVTYEPGELRVVAYDEQGRPAGEKVVRTAGKPKRLQLDVWTQHDAPRLAADGQDLAYVTVSLTDARGTLVPTADDQLTFEVKGSGQFEAACNGDATSLESFVQPTMKLFNGQLVVVVRSSRQSGTLTLRVSDPARKLSQTVTLDVN